MLGPDPSAPAKDPMGGSGPEGFGEPQGGAPVDGPGSGSPRMQTGPGPEAGRLEGRVALITGGGSGIGAATARVFAREGARVVVTGRRPEPIEAVAAATGGLAVCGDVRDDQHVTAAVGAAVGRFGGLDVVVANAGVGGGGELGSVSNQQWEQVLAVDLTGVMKVGRAAIPALLERGGGSIVDVASVSGLVADGGGHIVDAGMLAFAGDADLDW
jgi:NADP-dependent 3-hydroxy acid dehydrogenase YdfG